jgi:hypothetical protein
MGRGRDMRMIERAIDVLHRRTNDRRIVQVNIDILGLTQTAALERWMGDVINRLDKGAMTNRSLVFVSARHELSRLLKRDPRHLVIMPGVLDERLRDDLKDHLNSTNGSPTGAKDQRLFFIMSREDLTIRERDTRFGRMICELFPSDSETNSRPSPQQPLRRAAGIQ